MTPRAIYQTTVASVCLLSALVFPTTAQAHISLEQGGTHVSRDGDGNLKQGPCGLANSTRGTHIYTYAPGQVVTISIIETIPHPSYFRIAFDNDGDDAFVEPASILPIDPNRACPDGAGDHCGMSDFYNNASVLPGMDNLNPHMAGAGGAKYTWQVTMPNVTCNNCTLQIIQVMEDDAFHGPYDPTPGVGVEDIYHQCIDLVLADNAGGDAGTPPENDGGGAGGASAGAGGSSGAGGASAGVGGNGPGGSATAGSGGAGQGTAGAGGANGNSGGSAGNGAGGNAGSVSGDSGTAGANGSAGAGRAASDQNNEDSGCALVPGRTGSSKAPAAGALLLLGALALSRARKRSTATRH